MLRAIRWVASLLAGVLVVVLVTITLIKGTTGQQAADRMVPAPLATGTPFEDPRPLPRIPLLNEYGRPTSLQSFRGKWVIFVPAMTDCHEVCPMSTGVLMELEAMIRRAGVAKQVVVAEVTVDPWRDRPPRLRAYKRMTGAKFMMLTGSVPSILRLWKRLGILIERVPLEHPDPIDWYTHKPETLNIVHSDGLFILDPAGQLRVAVGGMPQVAEHHLKPVLRSLLDAEGIHNLEHPEAPYTAKQLMDDVDWALGREVPASSLAPVRPPSLRQAQQEVRGAPQPLASLHQQAGELLGSFAALRYRLKSLRGHPVVINAWASWCPPCRAEFPLFASAAAAFGRQVAFVGYDTNDQPEKAREFLAERDHAVSYPSYQGSFGELSELTPVDHTPTTIYLNRKGRVAHVQIGQYENQAALDADIARYALGEHKVLTGHKVGRFAHGKTR